FQFQTLGSVSSELVVALGLNYAEIGSLIGLFMLPGMFLAIPAGFAGRFVSDRFIVGLGLLTLGVGGGVASIAESFELLAAARLICGAGFVFSTIFFVKIVADLFAGKELATAMGGLVMSWPCGIAMGQIGHGWLAANFDWQMAFVVASIYCVIGALLVMIFCRDVPGAAKQTGGFRFTLNANEIFLTVIASLVWSLFNAGYIVYLSFAPSVLVASGYDMVSALGVISLASWLMIVSGVLCGLIADRSGKPDLILYVCMAAAVAAPLILFISPLAIPSSLLFGLMGMAPAGVIMALTAQAMKPENRAIGMGLFFTVYFLVQAPAPAIAGWLYDLTADEFWPILFAAALFLLTGIANLGFRIAQKRLPL
ncbi:MAG: MFS transporter, partial [Proteobacteria bacterium]|nr:MFS transporter [Pseudomonadota bacterium]